MTLEKAIERIDVIYSQFLAVGKLDDANALRLSSEALKRVQLQKKLIIRPSPPPLPGETTE